ncbi:MAG: SRPBCC domain-containing protein [Pseudomonadota bacterium]
MKKYSTSIQISADRERVWSALVEGLSSNPTAFGIVRFEGDLTPNGRVKLWSEVDPKRAFSLKVQEFNAPKKMIWKGGMPFGLFTGTRTFELSRSNGLTTFDMEEVFGGPLSGLIVKSIPDLNPSFEKFAQALK